LAGRYLKQSTRDLSLSIKAPLMRLTLNLNLSPMKVASAFFEKNSTHRRSITEKAKLVLEKPARKTLFIFLPITNVCVYVHVIHLALFVSRLALYVYEYLLHVGAQKAAQTFLSEVSVKCVNYLFINENYSRIRRFTNFYMNIYYCCLSAID
jgi:hypothetical protein